jgi:hypothetical protein
MKSEEARRFWNVVSRNLAAHPAVESVSLSSLAPLGYSLNEGNYRDAPNLHVTSFDVEPQFFNLMRVRIVAGRNFNSQDEPSQVAIVSRRLAREMYGSTEVLGRQFPKSGPGEKMTIIGVTADAHLIKVGNTTVAEIYHPLRPNQYQDLVLLARARGNPADLLATMRQVARLAEERVLAQARPMAADFERRTQAPRLVGAVAGGLAFLSLGLAGLGIFGAMSWSAAVRRKEIGIRVALGAPRKSVTALVLRGVAWPATTGVVIGMAAAIALSGAVAKGLEFVSANDTVAFVFALAMLALAGVLASLLPALRALRTDVLEALRQE